MKLMFQVRVMRRVPSLQNRSENRSHRNEMSGKGGILDIKQDMRNFMNGGK